MSNFKLIAKNSLFYCLGINLTSSYPLYILSGSYKIGVYKLVATNEITSDHPIKTQ
jgi:hypothetical protein